MTDKLTVEQCERGVAQCTASGRWDEAALFNKLADCMRENELLLNALEAALAALNGDFSKAEAMRLMPKED